MYRCPFVDTWRNDSRDVNTIKVDRTCPASLLSNTGYLFRTSRKPHAMDTKTVPPASRQSLGTAVEDPSSDEKITRSLFTTNEAQQDAWRDD
jgi:hypothetical protein